MVSENGAKMSRIYMLYGFIFIKMMINIRFFPPPIHSLRKLLRKANTLS